jgi:two-component system C4-dicarboxylate transport response regulator DctD
VASLLFYSRLVNAPLKFQILKFLFILLKLDLEKGVGQMTGERYKVLVVDDESSIRDIICETLALKGHLGFHAASGTEALEKFSAEDFDAAVIDVSMPQMDGISLTREIVKRKPDFPIMIMTGFKDAKINSHPVDEEALSAGAIDFLEKPFVIEVIDNLQKESSEKIRVLEHDLEELKKKLS